MVAEALRILRAQLRLIDPEHFDVIGVAFDIFLRGRYDHRRPRNASHAPTSGNCPSAHLRQRT